MSGPIGQSQNDAGTGATYENRQGFGWPLKSLGMCYKRRPGNVETVGDGDVGFDAV